MLRYSDRHPREERVPECYGRDSYYDQESSECRRCRFQHDCEDEIRNKRGVRIPVSKQETPSRPSQSLGMRGPEDRTHAGIILEGETPLERFLKDCATGACRGFFEEGCDFFRHWRW